MLDFPSRPSYLWSLLAGAALLLAACGTKPDGTPYGVNPAKHADGQAESAADGTARPHHAIGMPKGAEMNAVTSGATAGQAAATASQ